MKNLALLSICLLTMHLIHAQWIPQSPGTTKTLRSVYFIQENTGCAVGDSGTIIRTTDGGENWTNIPSETSRALLSVYFTSIDTGYISGDSGTILKTIDGGSTWQNQTSGTSNYLNSIHFPARDTGYATGGNAILKTVDGGLNWAILDIGNPLYFGSSVFFTDIDTGYVAGCRRVGWDCRAIILKTTNGGESWSICHEVGYASGFHCIYFTDANTGYVLGISNQFRQSTPISRKTNNAGSDWSGYFTFGGIWPYSMCWPSPDTGYIVGQDLGIVAGEYNISKTTDGGATAIPHFINTTSKIYSVFFIDVETGYVVGENGIIFKTTNGGADPVGVEESSVVGRQSSVECYPNPTRGVIEFRFTVYNLESMILKVFNAQGQEVAVIFDGELSAGAHTVQWDTGALPAGIYYYRLTTDDPSSAIVGLRTGRRLTTGTGKIVKY